MSTLFICFMTGGHFVWLPRQHSILKKELFQTTSSKPLKQYDSNLVQKLPLTYNGKMVKLHFMPHHKKWQVYYVIPSEILSVRLSGQTSKVLVLLLGYFGYVIRKQSGYSDLGSDICFVAKINCGRGTLYLGT